jgi:hypothetical protein
MSELPGVIFQKWGHSFEEDSGDTLVYRPADHDFPRARGRDQIEFRPDGTFIEWVVGRGDARQAMQGQWEVQPDHRLQISSAGGECRRRVLEIIKVGPDILEMRQRPA